MGLAGGSWGRDYLAVFAVVGNGIGLTAIVAGKHLSKFARDSSGQSVHLEQRVQQVAAGSVALERAFGENRLHRVFAAVVQMESLQRAPPAVRAGAAAAHLIFVRFFQILKALSSTVAGTGRRTEGPGAPHGGARALQVGRAGGLQVARRQPGVDDFERRGGGKRQAGHQQQREARQGPGHSVWQGAVAARSSAATGAGSIAAGGRSAPPRGSDRPRGPTARAR